MLLRYLKLITLQKATKIKQSNGTFTNNYTKINDYKVQMQNLTDDVISATIYGAKITKMFRISTPLGNLEEYLLPKVDNKQDNISDYYVEYNDKTYKIVSVSKDKIEIELVNSSSNVISL